MKIKCPKCGRFAKKAILKAEYQGGTQYGVPNSTFIIYYTNDCWAVCKRCGWFDP